MGRLTRKEEEQRKKENSLANWSKIIVKSELNEMTFEEKKEAYDKLTQEQQAEVNQLYDYFNSRIWATEPFKELFGVNWGYNDLGRICNT